MFIGVIKLAAFIVALGVIAYAAVIAFGIVVAIISIIVDALDRL